MMETFCGPEESHPIRVLQRAITKALREENRMAFGRTGLTSVILNEDAPSPEKSVGVYRLAIVKFGCYSVRKMWKIIRKVAVIDKTLNLAGRRNV
jgi:hypothetical protein